MKKLFLPASTSISKCGTDLIGRYYAEAYNLNTQITRMFTHFGPRRGDVFMESTFAKQIALIENGLSRANYKSFEFRVHENYCRCKGRS